MNDMTTQEVADRLITYIKSSDWNTAHAELYAENAVSLEMPNTPFPERTEGMEAIKQKGAQWAGMVEEFHGIEVSSPIVAGDFFSCTMTMDVKMQGAPRSKNEQIAIYKVEDGKVVSEQFFYWGIACEKVVFKW